MACARRVEPGFSPLDDELALIGGSLAPALWKHVVRVGAQQPFERAAQEIEAFCRVSISASTVRRQTLKAGKASAERVEQEVERLERECPAPPLGRDRPEKLVFSVDGAMVPLRGGEWAEVKTLAVGEVSGRREDGTVQTGDWSYFSRLTDAETFGRLALLEIERRGLTSAPAVAAVVDGAEWIQGFIDYHREDAVRILDFAHAAARVNDLCEILGEGSEQIAVRWTQLKEKGPEAFLSEVEKAYEEHEALRERLKESFLYLKKREAQLQYPRFQQAGWPLGSGSVESANKLVVEARLKGPGMHWKRENVNPMLALRTVFCSHRWESDWTDIVRAVQERQTQDRKRRRKERSELSRIVGTPTRLPVVEETALPTVAPTSVPPPVKTIAPPSPKPHPWRRFRPSVSYFSSSAKL